MPRGTDLQLNPHKVEDISIVGGHQAMAWQRNPAAAGAAMTARGGSRKEGAPGRAVGKSRLAFARRQHTGGFKRCNLLRAVTKYLFKHSRIVLTQHRRRPLDRRIDTLIAKR